MKCFPEASTSQPSVDPPESSSTILSLANNFTSRRPFMPRGTFLSDAQLRMIHEQSSATASMVAAWLQPTDRA